MKAATLKQIASKLLLLTFSIFLPLTTVLAADWPSFRNDGGNTGSSAETINLPLTEQWHSTAPLVEENGAVVANGVAYMLSNDGKLYAFNVQTGFNMPGFPVNVQVSYSSPAVDQANGKVYALTGTTLHAFNLNGTPAWAKAVGGTGDNYNQGPVIDEGFVYIKAGDHLQKFNAAGTLQWATATGGNDTQPAIMGGYVYSNDQAGRIHKFDKLTGVEQAGGFPIATGSQQASLTAVDGKLFFKAGLLYAYNATNGALLWSQPAGGNSTYYDSPAVSGGVVYVYGWDGKLYAFNENTGATMAGFPSAILNPTGDRNWSSPAVAGDKVFVGAGTSQKLKVLGAAGTAQAGQVLEEHLTFSTDTQGFDLCSPVISNGWVFAMLDGGGLYAFFGGGGTPPKGALTINNGATCTESPDVTLTLDNNNNPDVDQMRISEDPFFSGAQWQPYATTSPWTLSAGFGKKTIYAQLKDKNGLVSNVFTAQIDYSESCAKSCDINQDSKIDRTDISLIMAQRGKTVPPASPIYDTDGDGKITVNDARACVLKCTNANCAP